MFFFFQVEIATAMEKYQSCILHHWKPLTSRQQLIPSWFIRFLNRLSETHCGCQWLPTENDLYWPTWDDQESGFATRQQNCIQTISRGLPFSLFCPSETGAEAVSAAGDSCWCLAWRASPATANLCTRPRPPDPRPEQFSLQASLRIWESGSPSHQIKALLGHFSLLRSNRGLWGL